MTATIARTGRKERPAPWNEGLSTGEHPLDRPEAANPWQRTLPSRWEAPKSPELLAAETRFAALVVEQASLDERYAAALAAEDMTALVELRVRADLLPNLIESAERMMLRREVEWLDACAALIPAHIEPLIVEQEARRSEIERLNTELVDLAHALNELGGYAAMLRVQIGEINRRQAPPAPRIGLRPFPPLLTASERSPR